MSLLTFFVISVITYTLLSITDIEVEVDDEIKTKIKEVFTFFKK